MYENRTLVRGDNLEEMRKFPDDCIDLIATDPPFNSKRDYFVPYRDEHGQEPDTLIRAAFTDPWTWGEAAEDAYQHLLVEEGGQIGDTVQGLRQFLNETPMMAYLVMMAIRIVEMHRILKSTGSLYLHCDSASSHYLKIVLDAIFGASNFRNEIVWKRTSVYNDGFSTGRVNDINLSCFRRVHDIILFYSKNPQPLWNPIYTEHDPEYVKEFYRHEDERGPYRFDNLIGHGIRQGESGQPWQGVDPTGVGRCWSVPNKDTWPEGVQPPENYENLSVQEKLDALDANGLIYWPPNGNIPRFKRYLSMSKGRRVHDVIADINPLSGQSKERTGYPTQKPIELYKRIVAASSNEGDLVLDPFCGCGTTLMASEELNRHWIGIDLTYLATGTVRLQIERLFPQLRNEITITGTPENAEQALELARTNPHGFEEWCATHVLHFRPDARRDGVGGIDGTFKFPLGRVQGRQTYGRAVAQVKGGNYTLEHIRDFRTAMQGADLGVFVVTSPPSQGMETEASRTGTYNHPSYEFSCPKLQIYQIQDYFRNILPNLPLAEREVL